MCVFCMPYFDCYFVHLNFTLVWFVSQVIYTFSIGVYYCWPVCPFVCCVTALTFINVTIQDMYFFYFIFLFYSQWPYGLQFDPRTCDRSPVRGHDGSHHNPLFSLFFWTLWSRLLKFYEKYSAVLINLRHISKHFFVVNM